MARQCKVEIQEYAVGAHPCDTSSLAFRPRQENVGYTLDMVVTGSLEPHQAVVHHWTVNEVVVAGVLNNSITFQVNCRTHSKVSVWDNTPSVTRRGSNMAVPNLPPDVLADGPRASQ